MTPDIEIIEKEFGNVIEVEELAPMTKMPSVMGKNFAAIKEYLDKNNLEYREAPYAKYLDIDWDAQMRKGFLANFIEVFTKKWHFKVGFVIPSKVDDFEEMKSDFIPHKRYIQTMHLGAYHKVGNTYKRLYAYAKENSLRLGDISYEFYLNDPKEVKKDELETRVLIPID
ncbi:MAG: GyrI-like domain-containing protein [Bacteroidota bacterium]